jgi:uncharacterized membrane protein
MCKIIEGYTEPNSRLNCNLTIICSTISYALIPCVNLLKDTQNQVLVFLVVIYSTLLILVLSFRLKGTVIISLPAKAQEVKEKLESQARLIQQKIRTLLFSYV